MAIPLIILAVLSFPIVNILWFNESYVSTPEQPFVHAPEHAQTDQPGSPQFVQLGVSDAHAAEEGAHGEDTHGEAAHAEHGHSPAHGIAMVLSIIIASLGILLSWLFYHRKTFSAEAVASRFRPIYNVLWGKYYFDEFYNGVLVALTVAGSKALGLFDLSVIDGIVNGVARTVQAMISAFIGWFDNTFVDGLVNRVAEVTWSFGGRVRRLQTGAIQNYLLVILGGIVLLILIFRSLL